MRWLGDRTDVRYLETREPAALFIPALGREDQLGRYGLCDPPEPTPGASWMVPEAPLVDGNDRIAIEVNIASNSSL
jgi:hypothetical protein